MRRLLEPGRNPAPKMELIEKEVRRNLWLLQLFNGLTAADLVFAVIVPFYQQNGLSHSEIFVVTSGICASNLAFEIPSGRFADRYGRKQSLVLGATLLIVSSVVFGSSHGFWTVCIAGSILGVGFNFIGGADQALAYDSLKSIGREDKDYSRFEAISFTYRAIGGVSAALVGAWLASQGDIRLAVWAQIPVYVLLLCVAISLREVRLPAEATVKCSRANTWGLIKYLLHDHKELKWLLFYSAILTTSLNIVGWLRPLYYQLVEVPLGWFGVLQAACMIGMAVAARAVNWYEKRGRKKALWSFIIIISLGYTLPAMLSSVWLLPLFMSTLLVYSVYHPVVSNYINQLIESEMRASALSIISMITRLCFCITSPFIGWLVDDYSLSAALWFSAVLFGGFGVAVLVAMFKATSSTLNRAD